MKSVSTLALCTLLGVVGLLASLANFAESNSISRVAPTQVSSDEGPGQVPAASSTATASKGVQRSAASYLIAVEVPGQVSAGAEGQVSVTVQPKKGWKLNLEFPTKLVVVAPGGVTLSKTKLRKKDAAHFSEQKGSFAVRFKAEAAGDKTFTAKFKFAVCTERTCDPKTEQLTWVVSVK